jgi:glycosyltransferase involved in cell wall biosynthesis
VETYLATLIAGLSRRGHAVALVHEVEAVGRGRLDAAIPGLVCWPAPETAAAGRWRPEAVFLHDFGDLKAVNALLDAYPAVAFAHGYVGTCISGTKRFAFPRAAVCRRRFGPGCLTCYLPRRCGGLNPITGWRLYRQEADRLAALRRCDRLIVNSHYLRQEYRGHGFAPEKVRVLAPYVASPMLPLIPRPPTGKVLFVGRLTRLKGAALLPEALHLAGRALGRPLQLVLVGDGPERDRVRRAARRFRIALEEHGWIDLAGAGALLAAADVLAVPSCWPEPYGLVGPEAARAGVPAVAFPVGGIGDWLIPGVTGAFAPAGRLDAPTFAAGLVRALHDEGHWQRLREGCWRRAQAADPESHLAMVEAILSEVVQGRGTVCTGTS